jgi:hypothetical protein
MSNIKEDKVAGKKFYYSQGFTQATAKRICQYFLGDYFFKLQSNHKTRTYDCFIKNKIMSEGNIILVDKSEIAEFQKFWSINCIILDVTNIE